MVQLFLDCVDRATEPSSAFVLFREQPTHFNDNQTLNLRVVDPIADDGVWAIIDEGCNSCCHGETTFNDVGTSTTSGKFKIPMAIRLQEFDLVMPGCVHSHEILQKTHLLLVGGGCGSVGGVFLWFVVHLDNLNTISTI